MKTPTLLTTNTTAAWWNGTGQLPLPDALSTTRLITRFRWLICALLFLATTINYIDRQILALLKPMLDTELGWANE